MTKEELFAVIGSLTDGEIAQIRETIAPTTKISRLQEQAQTLMSDINAAAARAKANVQPVLDRLNSGDPNVEIPTWASLVETFNGGR